MKKQIVQCCSGLAMLGLLAACGGGGGGGGGATVAKSSTATVSGTTVAISAIAAKSSSSLTDVAIEVVSFDKSDKELGRAAVTTDAKGGFAAQVPLLDTGGYVIVKAKKDGFSEFTKRLDYTTPGNIELQAALQGLTVAFANVSSTQTTAVTAGIGKSTEPSFSFAVVRFPNGVKKALAGTAIRAAKAAGAVSELDINIPGATLPGVKKLKAELNTFDPATESDRFPGSYVGTDASGKDGKMVSLAFDFMKINNAETGENIGEIAKKLVKAGVSKAAAKTTTVTRTIYTSSCDNLFIEDYNKTAPGWQVPVWSLNSSSGKWVFIGEGTVVDTSGKEILSPVKGTDASGGTAATGCKAGGYRLKIDVSNQEFLKSWWNLDHIVFDTPKEVCLTGKFLYSNGDPVANMSVSVYGSNLDAAWKRTGTDGTYTINSVMINKNLTDKSGTLSYWNENGLYKTVAVTLGDSPSCTTKDITLPKPCEVSGKLVDSSNAAVANRWLNLQGGTFYRGTMTDSTGAFSSQVACNTDISLYAGNPTTPIATFNVNGTPVSPEVTDSANKVTLGSLTAPNIPPYGYAYLSQRSIKTTGTISADISGYDEDGNYPVAYSLDILNGTTTAKSYTGSLTATANYLTQAISGLAVGDYTVQLVLTDSKGASRTVPAGLITVSDGSRPPVVNAFASQLAVNSCGTNNQVTLYGNAYDPDGDALSGTWTPSTCAADTGTSGYISSACAVTVTGNTTYTYKVDDSTGKSTSKSVTVNTFASAPWVSTITTSPNPALIPEGSTGTARQVTVTATPNHADGIAMAGSWTINGAADANCPDVTSVASGTGTSCTYTIPSTAVAGDTYTIRFTATGCGKTGFRETKVTYGNLADVNIVVQ